MYTYQQDHQPRQRVVIAISTAGNAMGLVLDNVGYQDGEVH